MNDRTVFGDRIQVEHARTPKEFGFKAPSRGYSGGGGGGGGGGYGGSRGGSYGGRYGYSSSGAGYRYS